MKFEGEHRNIPLHGIERNAANMVAQDGAMNEVIGLIPRNGSFIAYAPTNRGASKTNDVVMVRVHHTSTGDNVITVKENNYLINGKDTSEQIIVNNYEVWVNNGRCGQQVLQTKTETKTVYKQRTVLDIVFVGNRMDILTKENGIEHWLWKNGQYENVDDLAAYSNDGKPLLPSVDFKVRRGIYDGSKVWNGARYIKVHKSYTDSDTSQEDKDAATSYVRGLGSVGSDVLALLDSVRYRGGITGYVLVAAAYRRKGGDPSNPQYMMASPIMLMGAPEIYTKDGVFENNTGLGDMYIKAPTGTYMIDMFGYGNKSASGGSAQQESAFDSIWAMTDTDDRDTSDLAENENADIEMQSRLDQCIIRKITGTSTKGYTESYKADEAIDVSTSRQQIQQPALYSIKYALYNHGNKTGTIDRDAEYRGFRISHATANVLSFKINGDILEEYKDEIDRLCIFISPIISPYKHNDDVGVVMRSNYSGSKRNKYDGFFFCEKTCSDNYKMNKSACGGSFTPEMKSESEIRKDIEQIAGLYKVQEIQFSDLKPNQWVDLNLSGGKLESDRMVQHSDTMLKITDMQPVSIVTGGIFGYNERLHVYNFQKSEIYRLPYSCLQYFYGGGQYRVQEDGVQYEYSVEVRDHNDSLITSQFSCFSPAINPLVSYADTTAKNIRVVKRCRKNNKFYVGSKDFTPLEFGGIASGYINTSLKPLNIELQEVSLRDYDGAFRSDKIESDSNAYGKNEIRVSKPGLIEFEVDKSYKVGNGEILALARMTMGLSQDNYGKYPLVIFTTDGIYTLDVDSTGAGAYNIQSPLSRLVCTNPNGICELDGAVLFPTEYGLHMVTVDGVKPVVLQANGKPWNLPEKSAGLEMYRNAINHKKIVKLLDDISYEDFLVYINAYSEEDRKNGARYGTHIRFLHAINSVVVYNRNMPYSYMIELTTWTVTKLEQRIMFDDNDFPKQTFWIEPENENVVSIEEEVTETEEVDGEEVVTTKKKWTDLTDFRKRIDGDVLLRRHLTAKTQSAITNNLSDIDVEIAYKQGEIASLDASAVDYAAESDSVFEASGTTKSTVLANIAERKSTLLSDIDALQSRRSDVVAASAIDYGSLELSDADEAVLNTVGLKSVGSMLNDQQKKNYYTELKNSLVDAELSRTVGVVNSTIMQDMLGAGKLTLTLKDGLWTKGERVFTEQQLADVGLQVATEATEGMKYQITTVNENLVAVQFDYQTGLDNVQCLLQTRPIMLESTHLKSAYRVVLRGSFEKTNDDTVITSENNNKFNIINTAALANYCDGKDVVLNYRLRERVTLHTNKAGMTIEKKTYSWQWETEDGEKVKLKDIGLQQAGSITKDDSITIAPKIHFAGLYVFGSLDGNHWTPIGAEEKLLSSNRFHDIGCRTHRVSFRYLMVVFAATLSQDSHIDGLEITSDVKYNDKLK